MTIEQFDKAAAEGTMIRGAAGFQGETVEAIGHKSSRPPAARFEACGDGKFRWVEPTDRFTFPLIPVYEFSAHIWSYV